MIIIGKRKRKLDKQLLLLKTGARLIAGLPVNKQVENTLLKMGFTKDLNEGETILPSADIGPICNFNSEGKYVKHKDKPMETAYRQVEWTWEQWAGYYGTETQSRIVDVPYKRYPRTHILPPSIELSISQNELGEKYIVAPEQKLSFSDTETLLHSINIFLEIFGRCEIFSEKLESYMIKKYKRLNWKILPPGKWPWEKVEKEVKHIVNKTSEQNRVVIKFRLQTITEFNQEFAAIGQAGFAGYIIFGFPKKNLYILESLYLGNATYIFEEKWKELSKLTKAEIIKGKLLKDRIIHREHWESQIRNLMKQ